MRTVFIVLACVLILDRTTQAMPDDLFTTQVRPILARHCLKCHGPDDKARKGRLRLDVRSEAVKPAASGSVAIAPGDVEQSELLTRIFSDDETEVMPPPSSKNPLTQEQKQILKRWIAEGAEYREHWSFLPPKQVEPPAVKLKEWPRNTIDRFVLARLESEGLSPSPEADRATLIRRLSLDLIGLPPTPEEVKAFVEDPSPQAYESAVDRLLRSPHYGERWARRWLDLARYADTNGYEKDRPRSIWPYRDWVINAINDDMHFAQFTVEQIAGDMLPNASVNQRVATGFHRNTMLNEEGGIDPLEFRFYAMNDRVTTTGTTWLGLTLLCAQCHTHKYDPIPHRDYYRFMALLDNADEPELALPSPQVEAQRKEIEQKIAALIEKLPDQFPVEKVEEKNQKAPLAPEITRRKAHYEKKLAAWLNAESADAVRWTVLKPSKASSVIPRLVDEGNGTIFVEGDQSKRDVYTLAFDSHPLETIRSLRLVVLPDPRLPKNGPGRVYYEGPPGDFFLSEFKLTADGKPLKVKAATQSFAGNGAAGASAAIDGDPQTGWTINGGQGREHSAVFILEQPIPKSTKLTLEMVFERYHAAGLGKFRIEATAAEGTPIASDTPTAVAKLLRIPLEKRTAEQKAAILRQFLMNSPDLAEARKPIDALQKSIPAATTTLVMQERSKDNPRATFVHHRGEWLQTTEKVDPAVLSILPALPADGPKDRLALARWLASPTNPLSGRVTVNRQWAAIFGTGIVRTTEDFGYQGESPSHPELLDWLAVEFMKTGSLKQLHKSIVMSATYRQDSRATPALLARDPKNRLLARGPRVRLDAEAIRDQALRVSGLLSEKVGGPSVFPPQPPGVTTEGAYGAFNWKVSEGPDRYRRGLYTFSKRTTPYAMFNTFDGPSGEFCLARREVSNTPLQALMLLNDPVFEDAARALGKRFATEAGSVDARVDRLFRQCLARAPEEAERRALTEFYEKQLKRFEKKELDPAKVMGDSRPTPQAAERAAWTMVARALLNLDETVTKG